jgi:predicted transcriptional regulator
MARQSYNDVIMDLIEDSLELNEKTKMEIKEAVEDYNKGNYITHKEVKKKFGF